MILTSLPLLDQVCFALSCQYVFGCLLSSLKSQGLELSQLFPREKYPRLCRNVEKKPRVQFLRRLENERWKCCCDCWTLHPQFAHVQLDEEDYCVDCQKMHDRHCFGAGLCMPHAGQVEICPCLTISFRDMLQLIKISCSPTSKSVDYGDVFETTTSKNFFEHRCDVKHPVMDAQVTTTLEIYNASLYVKSKFQFVFSGDHSSKVVARSSLCPHKNPSAWLRRFFDEAGSDFSGWLSVQETSSIDIFPYSPYLLHGFELRFMRSLGGSEWPNEDWNLYRCN